jgi:hypothetical protein
MFVNGSGQNEQSLERTFHRFFLPSFTSFGSGVSEKIKMWKGRQTTDAKWWQKLTLPLARWAKKRKFWRYIIQNKSYFHITKVSDTSITWINQPMSLNVSDNISLYPFMCSSSTGKLWQCEADCQNIVFSCMQPKFVIHMYVHVCIMVQGCPKCKFHTYQKKTGNTKL